MKLNGLILFTRHDLWRRCASAGLALALTASAIGVAPAAAADVTITVTTTVDELNADGDCSLREAIQAANANAAVDACPAGTAVDVDRILLADATYTLGIAGTTEDANATGDLDVTAGGTVSIQGMPFGHTILSGGFGDRVLDVHGSGARLELSFVTVRDGLTVDEPGAGIRTNGRLILMQTTVTQNNALGNTADSAGGGICVGCGAGTGSAWLSLSNVIDNHARSGGGIFTNRTLMVSLSSVISNTSTVDGAGIYGLADLILESTLVSNNTSSTATGGIASLGTLSANNVTLSNNSGAITSAGGIAVFGSATLSNTILSNNVPGNCVGGQAFSSGGHNLSSDSSCETPLTQPSDLNATSALLGDLQANGFSSFVRPPLPGSPAIDAGDNATCVTNDQRGVVRPVDGDAAGAVACDIGAFEFIPRLYVDATVTGEQTGLTWPLAMTSLQDALAYATRGTEIWVADGVYYPDDARTGAPDVRTASFVLKDLVDVYGGFAGTETSLSQRNPAVNSSILSGDLAQNDVNGDGNHVAETYTDIAGTDNAYHVVTAAGGIFGTFDGFIVTAGNANGTAPNNVGGGIYNNHTYVDFANLLLRGNSAVGGGGMLNTDTSATLTNVGVIGNFGTFGGGMQNDAGSNVTLTNVTFSHNVGGIGGGLFNANSNPYLTNVTFSNNAGNAASGGNLYNSGSAPRLINTLIANSVSGGDCINAGGSFIAAGSSHNLIEDDTTACGLVHGVNGNLTAIDPFLDDLPTTGGTAITRPLLLGSQMINAGTNVGCPAFDQRRVYRPMYGVCDIGAYEYGQTQLFLPSLRK